MAIASWALGAAPPVAQVLSPPTDHEKYATAELGRAAIVIGPTAITALWTAGGVEPYSGPGETHLDEAFGKFGEPLQAVDLMTAPRGIWDAHLALEPDGRPIASWIDDGNKLRTVQGLLTGALRRSVRLQPAPGFRGSTEEGEFSSDPEGDTVFSYLTGASFGAERLMAMTSTAGGPFGRPRTIASAGWEDLIAPTVVAGGNRTILALWGCDGEQCSNDWGRRGNVFGRFGVPFRVGVKPEGFVDSHGRTVIAYDRGSTLEAIAAEADRPFGRPRRIVTSGRECELYDEEAPVPASGNGDAIFEVGCFVGGREYVVRYTP